MLLVLGASSLIQCGSSGASPGFNQVDAGVDAHGGADAGSAGTKHPGHDASLDAPRLIQTDTSTPGDASACTQLSIGILGGPGANPSSDFQAWLVSAGTSVQRIQNVAPAPTLTAATLAPFDVVILDWLTRDYTPAEAAIFASFVSARGGVVSMSGYSGDTTSDWHANTLLAPLELAYTGALLSGPVTDFAVHPITAGLTSVTFEGGYAIADLGGAASSRTPIGFLPGLGDSGIVPVAYAVEMSMGRAFVWGDEWIEFDSEWSMIPEIKQLWIQAFAWIAPANKCKLAPPK